MSEKTPNNFDIALPERPQSLLSSPTRLVLDDKVYPLDNPHRDAKAIYHTIHTALLSDWWREMLTEKSIRQYKSSLSTFLNWLRDHQLTEGNRFDVLNDYQAFRVNEGNVKPQSTGARPILTLLQIGCDHGELEGQYRYIETLIDSTKILETENRIPDTLTGWFSQMDWLRTIVGDDDWLAMESPKFLMESFSVTIASTLLWVQKVRSDIRALVKKNPHLATIGENLQNKSDRNAHYCRELLILASRDPALPAGTLDLLLADFAQPGAHEYLRSTLRAGKSVSLTPRIDGRYKEAFFLPTLFALENIDSPSEIESQLAAWLCAWQTVQVTDIKKLKPHHFTIHTNKQGRPISLQCNYYKGRSGRHQEPPVLDAQQIEFKALIKFLNTWSCDNQRLFSNFQMTVKYHPNSTYTTFCRSLVRIWTITTLSHEIQTKLNTRKASDRFRRLFMASARHGGEAINTWQTRQKKLKQPTSINAYHASVARPLPQLLFGASAIKTSAVQARSDQYRDGDFVDVNSHSAAIEKMHYMTDQNKEWVNQNGRITRIVLIDIENHAYKPNLDQAVISARERRLQTKVMQVAPGQSVRINPLGEPLTPSPSDTGLVGEADEYIVWDTPETVVCFLHYLAETERQSNQLIAHALSFFERTVLPTAEWMSSLLNNGLSPMTVRAGRQQYDRLRGVLPALFNNQLHGGVGT
ncbi:hypothetical protein NB663_07295 [Vibrio parahaemolyticus]|uniref:hypothetical protein n=1 Tax=Vibrio parahaemolyticus TaxID=670 RepID=UPI00215BEAB9|nr:hypothetical protein [Vibrio parahaemolyticus]MCR9780338.1 hypothetical protein [Vibrio parahaemolyticus]